MNGNNALKSRKGNKPGNKNKNKGRRAQNREIPMNTYTEIIRPEFGPVEPRRRLVFKYAEAITLASIAAAGYGLYVFRLNSLFDFNLTGTGHQPYGYDAVMLFYNRYLVYSVKYKVTFLPNIGNVHYVVVPSNGAIAISTAAEFDTAGEMPYSLKGAIGSISAPTLHLKHDVDLPRLNGASVQKYRSDDAFSSTSTASPSELIYLNLGVFNGHSAAIVQQMDIQAEIRCEVFDVLPQSQSFLHSRLDLLERAEQCRHLGMELK
jgi:hypothetical protein